MSLEDVTATDLADLRERQLEAQWEARVPQRFRHARLGKLGPETVGPIARWVASWRADVDDEGPVPGALVLYGPVGTGKTYAALAACWELQVAPMFWPVVELLDALRPSGGLPTLSPLEQGLLVLDDLGAERATDWSGERLYALVNRRWMNEAPTVVTANVASPQELRDSVGARVYSRLADGATLVRMTGQDRRLER